MIEPAETVFIRKRKRPIGSGVWRAYVLGTDADGLWLHTPAGSVYRGEDGQTVGLCEVAQNVDGSGRDAVYLIPATGWWIATWLRGASGPSIAIDICTPPTRIGSEWVYVDLELDPYRTPAGEVGTDDWDEFLDACVTGHISPVEAQAARAATAEVERWLAEKAGPFGRTGARWLDAVGELTLPPLVDLGDAPTFPQPLAPG